MGETKLDAYCGLYCGACSIYQLSEKARKTGVPARREEMPDRFKGLIKEAEIVCHGCKSDTLFAGCRVCPLVKCAKKKGVESCALCHKYPCFYYTMMNIVVYLRRLEQKLPHIKVRKPNLAFIRQNGVDAFLAEQERIWACSGCGSRFSWYQESCNDCGEVRT
jgi:hypothetical protein